MDKIRILIVEDDKITRRLYDKFLSDRLFEKRLIPNGEEAFEAYRTWQPDIVILDIMLPAISGYVILNKIREEMGDKRTPILIASSLSTKMDVLDCARLGVQGFLAKPIQWKEIAQSVLECFEKVHPEKTDGIAAWKKILQEDPCLSSTQRCPL